MDEEMKNMNEESAENAGTGFVMVDSTESSTENAAACETGFTLVENQPAEEKIAEDVHEENVYASDAAGSFVKEHTQESAENYSSRYNSYDYNTYYNNPASNPPEPKKKGFGKFMKTVGLALCFGVVAAGAFFLCLKGLKEAGLADFMYIDTSESTSQISAENSASGLVIAATSVTGVTDTDDNAVVEVVKENMSCTVCINCTFVTTQSYFGQKKEYTTTGSGTGFIVGSNDTELLIATNNHVVEDAATVQVVFADDTEVSASVRATDANYDLAIVSVPLDSISAETMAAISVATLGSSDDTQVGQMVIAIGNALGYGQSVTVGYLSAKDREVTVDGVTMTLLQTDAAINGGNSGGPLFNTNGEVIGINCAKYSDTSVEGMCFAIPISAAIPILEELMTKEVVTEAEQGYLGVTIVTVPSSYIRLYGYPEGIFVNDVVEDGGAYNAGILKYDIITAVNGVTVTTSDELKSAVNSYKYGTVVSITYYRQDSDTGEWVSNTVDVTLTKNPNN